MGQNNYLCPKDGEDSISFLNILCFLFLILSAARIGTGTDLHLELMKLVTIIHMSYIIHISYIIQMSCFRCSSPNFDCFYTQAPLCKTSKLSLMNARYWI